RGRRAAMPYGVALACFIAAQLCKPSAAVALPMIATIDLLVLRRRPVRQVAPSLLPWVLAALPLLAIARIVQETGGIAPLPIRDRLLVMSDSLTFYLWKLFWPMDLGFDYGRTPEVALSSGAA